MGVKIKVNSIEFQDGDFNRKVKIKEVMRSIKKTGLTINFSDAAREMKSSITSVYDSWQKFLEKNEISVHMTCTPKNPPKTEVL